MLITMSRLFRCNKIIAKTPEIGLFLVRNIHKEPIRVAWEKPKAGWTKLNFDGSFKGKTGNASIGGVVRGENAEFLLGYAESIGHTTSTMAELAALRRGLEFIDENGWRDVWVEGDAKGLVDLIGNGSPVKSLEAKRYVTDIYGIVNKLDNFIFTHIYREGNKVADKFAQMGQHLEKPLIWRVSPPDEVEPFMHDDAIGKVVLRKR